MANKQFISKDQLQAIITDGKLEISSAILEEAGKTREDFVLANEFSSVELKLDEKASLLPTYPEVIGKVSSKTNSENTITATLNLTPILGSQTPLFTWTGTNDLAMGKRTISLAYGWLDATKSDYALQIPATSGTLATMEQITYSVRKKHDITYTYDSSEVEKNGFSITADEYKSLLKSPSSSIVLIATQSPHEETVLRRLDDKVFFGYDLDNDVFIRAVVGSIDKETKTYPVAVAYAYEKLFTAPAC